MLTNSQPMRSATLLPLGKALPPDPRAGRLFRRLACRGERTQPAGVSSPRVAGAASRRHAPRGRSGAHGRGVRSDDVADRVDYSFARRVICSQLQNRACGAANLRPGVPRSARAMSPRAHLRRPAMTIARARSARHGRHLFLFRCGRAAGRHRTDLADVEFRRRACFSRGRDDLGTVSSSGRSRRGWRIALHGGARRCVGSRAHPFTAGQGTGVPWSRWASAQQQIVTSYIDGHLCEQIRSPLAQLVRLSTFYFCRAFKQSRRSAHRYHTNRRIEEAKVLLAAAALGDRNRLILGFSKPARSPPPRKTTGQTPSSYCRGLA